MQEQEACADSESAVIQVKGQTGEQQASTDRKNGERFPDPVERCQGDGRQAVCAFDADHVPVEEPVEKNQGEQNAARAINVKAARKAVACMFRTLVWEFERYRHRST
ncbi:hypothetical protein GCM10009712_37370 [Pseudarthrobacter sulfonivorans]